MRITEKILKNRIELLNEITNNPKTYSTMTKEGSKSNVGHYFLDMAYGGYDMVQVSNEAGGLKDVFYMRGTKRELFDKLTSFIDGIVLGKTLV